LINDGGVTDQVPQWEIDKVIDWDRVLAVPKMLARKPPMWLWTSSEILDNSSVSSFYDGDIDILSLSWNDNDTLAPADWHIKQYFEDGFVEQLSKISPGYTKAVYLEESYGKGQ
jgi:hypothetical protein